MTDFGINKLGEISFPVEQAYCCYRNMHIGIAFQGISRQNAKSSAVIGNFARTVQIFLDKAINDIILAASYFRIMQKIEYRVKDIRISANFHGNVDCRVSIRFPQLMPDPVKGILGDAEKSPELVMGNQIPFAVRHRCFFCRQSR